MNSNAPMMLFIRSLIFTIGQGIATIVIASIGLLFFFVPFKLQYWWITRWSHFIVWWAKIICGIHYNIIGMENLPAGNAIILSKHQSAWETIFYQTVLPPQCWVLKRELLMIPFFGWALALLEPIAINRKNKAAIKQLQQVGTKRLQQGRWVVIFPEGTRVAPGETHSYSRSGASLSAASGYPIVPIAHNAGEFWPKNSFIKRPGTITVQIGPALYPAECTLDELHQRSQAWIENTMENITANKFVGR